MEIRSLRSPTFSCITTSSLPPFGLLERSQISGQAIKVTHLPKCRGLGRLKSLSIRAQRSSSGKTRFSSTAVKTIQQDVDVKDENLVFVAGATGKVGSRTVRELLKLGFRVRAGVRSAQRAETLVQSVKQMNLDAPSNSDGTPAVERLEIIECDLEKPDQIGKALGNSSLVICCIGASEKEIFDVTGPYRIDYMATRNLIDAATVSKIDHFILLTSLGTSKFGFPAAILNLFWGVLCWKRRAEEALLASGLPYTIVRPGGMERPTDSYKETHNVRLSRDDTLFGGQVSNLQVAELMASMARNRNLAYCKILEVVAETTAPLRPMEELLSEIPSNRAEVKSSKVPGDAALAPDPSPEKTMTSAALPTSSDKVVTTQEPPEPNAAKSEEEPKEDKALTERSLSPYTAYDDLKPPTSPSPSPPCGSQKETKAVDNTETQSVTVSTAADTSNSALTPSQVQEVQPLSPYVAYEDLKPPSSPSPTSPGRSREVPLPSAMTVDAVPPPLGDNGAPNIVDTDATVGRKLSQESTYYHSPFPVYEDFKPPTSPTPTAPNSSPISTASVVAGSQIATISDDNSTAESNATEQPVKREQSEELKLRSLSTYAMYDDLKSPSSPDPSAPNLSSTSSPLADAASQVGTVANDDIAESKGTDKQVEEEQLTTDPKPRPLSPFTMYEDMKPPTTPQPSSRKH